MSSHRSDVSAEEKCRPERYHPDLHGRRRHPELTGEALRRFQEVTRFKNDTDLGNKIVVEKKPKAKAQPKSPAPKLPDEQPEPAKARPAGAEADVEMKTTDATQPKVAKRPAGTVASETAAAAKPGVKAKAMPRAPPMPVVFFPLSSQH